jgi:hypothetical protein
MPVPKRTPEKIAQMQQDMRDRQAAAPPEFVRWQVPKGIYLRGNLPKKVKNDDVMNETLRSIGLQPCPDELLIGPLSSLRGTGLRMIDALAYRMWFDSLTGKVPKFGTELLNRLGGRVPYVHDQDKEKDNGLSQLTPEQIKKESLRILKSIKDLLVVKKPAKDVVSESDPDSLVTATPEVIISGPEEDDGDPTPQGS